MGQLRAISSPPPLSPMPIHSSLSPSLPPPQCKPFRLVPSKHACTSLYPLRGMCDLIHLIHLNLQIYLYTKMTCIPALKILPFPISFRVRTTDTDAFLPCPRCLELRMAVPQIWNLFLPLSVHPIPSPRSRALRIYGQFVHDYISPTAAATGRVDIAVIVGNLAGWARERRGWNFVEGEGER